MKWGDDMRRVAVIIAVFLCIYALKGFFEKGSEEAITGGIVVGVEPKVVNESNPEFKIYLRSTENKDDVVEIKIEKMNRTIVREIKAGEELWIPMSINPVNTTTTTIIKITARSMNLNASSSASLLVLGGG
ncbi:MAG: hypothetical protein DRO65_03705 [Candidatus Altiarchaeales archaeon]|nr:MAG: hypothetical protein DRO65_03705 [Candidatus Altiarchaeales archaeon]